MSEPRKKKVSPLQAILLLLAAGAIYAFTEGREAIFGGGTPAAAEAPATPSAPRPAESRNAPDDADLILRSFQDHRNDVMVEAGGHVDRTLPDDEVGSRHQRFVVRLQNGHTVLIAHNIDLAPRVPLRQGDAVRFRGEFEWSERGGVVHWTHHDPQKRHPGGWIQHGGKTFE